MKRLMTEDEAEILADSIIRQFSEIPLAIPASKRVFLDPKGLAAMILRAGPVVGSSKMQFRVRGKEEQNTFYKYSRGNNGYPLQKFCVQRVLSRDDSGLEKKPIPGVRQMITHPYESQKVFIQKWAGKRRAKKEAEYDAGKWDPEVICRRFRHEIQPEIRKDIAGLWGIGATYETILPIDENKDSCGGEMPGYARTFLIIFPGLTKVYRDIVARDSIKYQRPKHEDIPYVEHDILEERLYTCPILNKYKSTK